MKLIKSEHTAHYYAFDSFLVDTAKSVLVEGERIVSLTPKAFELLLALVQNPGNVLRKEDLLELVWANTFVDENNLPRTISALRKALGEDPTEHKYIVTVPGQGYRFVAAVRELETPESVVEQSLAESFTQLNFQADKRLNGKQDVVNSKSSEVWSLRNGLIAGILLLVLGLSVFAYFLLRQNNNSTQLSPQHKLWQLTFEPGLEI